MPNISMIDAIGNAVRAHGPWRLKLQVAVETGHCEITPDIARCDDCCEFGKWLYGQTISSSTKSGIPYQVVKRLHADFHTCAGKVLELAIDKRSEEAHALLKGEFDERSHTLIVALNKWKRELSMDEAA